MTTCPTCGAVYPDLTCRACLVYLAAEHHAHGYDWQPATGRTEPDWQIEDGETR